MENEYVNELDNGEASELQTELQLGTDNDSSDLLSSDDNVNNVPDALEPTFENLLKEYIKTQLEPQEESVEGSDSEEIEEEVTEIDYTQLLNDIINNQETLQSYSEYVTGYLENYDIYNNLNADVNDISLTNALLLLLFVCFLFNAALSFARSIFL